MVFLVLYVDDILLIGNDVGALSAVKVWLSHNFDMKDLGEVSYIVGIKLMRDRKNRMLILSQAAYIDKMLVKFAMHFSYLSGMELLFLWISVLGRANETGALCFCSGKSHVCYTVH